MDSIETQLGLNDGMGIGECLATKQHRRLFTLADFHRRLLVRRLSCAREDKLCLSPRSGLLALLSEFARCCGNRAQPDKLPLAVIKEHSVPAGPSVLLFR
jgi:hypothetical protein